MATTNQTARLEARISPALNTLLRRAVEIEDTSITDFVASAIREAAQRTIERAEVLRLSLADQECFAQALLAPPAPVPALERAFARRRELLGGN